MCWRRAVGVVLAVSVGAVGCYRDIRHVPEAPRDAGVAECFATCRRAHRHPRNLNLARRQIAACAKRCPGIATQRGSCDEARDVLADACVDEEELRPVMSVLAAIGIPVAILGVTIFGYLVAFKIGRGN